MRKTSIGILLLSLRTVVASDGGDVVETRTRHEVIPLDGRETVLLAVDNVFGSIHVTGHDEPRIEIVAEEKTVARSQTAFERARKDVRLDIGREGDEVTIFVDGPFRERNEYGFGRHRSLGYTVTYDFEIRVPRRTHLDVRTVNSGEIHVEGVQGDLRAGNVNGEISLERIGGGTVRATTVNGPVKARFDKNPTGDSTFQTVNGNLEMWLQPGLSAELRFKTFSGEARTDFDVEPLPYEKVVEQQDGDRRVYRMREWSRVRVARGGPQLSFETLNGNILIRNARGPNSASR
jgi:hypothetical protein